MPFLMEMLRGFWLVFIKSVGRGQKPNMNLVFGILPINIYLIRRMINTLKQLWISVQPYAKDEYPMRAKKISIMKINKTFIVFRNREKIYLEKRALNDIWGGLWSFMETEDKKNIQAIIKDFDRNSKIVKRLEPFIHKLSHREIK